MDSDELLRQAINGDEQALMTLIRGAGPLLLREIEGRIEPRYRSLVDVDDILQITCVEALLRVRSFNPLGPGSFDRWLRRIAENNLRDALRELERDKRPPPGLRVTWPDGDESYVVMWKEFADPTSTAGQKLTRQEQHAGLDEALAKLPEEYARVLRLYYLEGLSGEEIAERMGRSHGAIRMLLARARTRLREVLKADPRFGSSM